MLKRNSKSKRRRRSFQTKSFSLRSSIVQSVSREIKRSSSLLRRRSLNMKPLLEDLKFRSRNSLKSSEKG